MGGLVFRVSRHLARFLGFGVGSERREFISCPPRLTEDKGQNWETKIVRG